MAKPRKLREREICLGFPETLVEDSYRMSASKKLLAMLDGD